MSSENGPIAAESGDLILSKTNSKPCNQMGKCYVHGYLCEITMLPHCRPSGQLQDAVIQGFLWRDSMSPMH